MIRTTLSGLKICRHNKQILTTAFINDINNQQQRNQQNEATNQSAIDKNFIFTPSGGYIRTSPFQPVFEQNTTLDKYVWKNLKRWEKKIAAACVVTGRDYTYAKLRDCSAAFAVRIQQKLKLKPREVISICLPNVPEYAIALLGAVEAGLTVSTINPIYTPDEISRLLLAANAKAAICFTGNYEIVKKATQLAKLNIPIICIKAFSATEKLSQNAIDFFEMINPEGIQFSDLRTTDITENDIVFLPFSSGTTGLPKGVLLTHSNITINCEMAQAKVPDEGLTLETTESVQEVVPCFLPYFHIYGLTITMLSKLHLGCQLVTIPKFTPEDLLKSLTVYKGTILNLVPPIVLMLTNHPNIKKEHFPHLRSVMSGAAPIGQLDVERFLNKFSDVIFSQGYGLTETSPVVLLTPNNNKKYYTTGVPVSSTQAKIVSINDNENAIGLGPNKSGEICVRGPQVMKGYLNNEEATKEAFFADGWLRTGDIGYYDDAGFFIITDRMKELIKVKGFQVPPAELEELLRDHPKISDAAVVGIPHGTHGEIPRAAVVLKPGENATENEIKEFIKEKVVHYKQLAGGVEFMKEIPKSPTGKIMRRILKEYFLKSM